MCYLEKYILGSLVYFAQSVIIRMFSFCVCSVLFCFVLFFSPASRRMDILVLDILFQNLTIRAARLLTEAIKINASY